MSQENPQQSRPWYWFMSTNEWVVFMNIMRVLTFILLLVIIFILINEIEAVKLLAYDPCKICMNKTGAQCFLPPRI